MGSLGDLSNNLRRWFPEKIPFMLSAKQVHGSIFRIQSMQPGQLSRLGKTLFSTALSDVLACKQISIVFLTETQLPITDTNRERLGASFDYVFFLKPVQLTRMSFEFTYQKTVSTLNYAWNKTFVLSRISITVLHQQIPWHDLSLFFSSSGLDWDQVDFIFPLALTDNSIGIT